ncbi:MAG TPA: phosphoribosylamine--glycine ligase [Candidatus Limnocylindrales bacterium]|nr:phosphoribosylamine--glycine ligase [Candidatus Limnocylindrales bacterium]
MDVLVLGSGAREHALAWRLARDEGVRRVRIAPGNGGTPAVAETVAQLDIGDPAAVARHASRERYGLVVIGPEAPLAAGMADALATASIPVFGPSRSAARLESSKAYAKAQLQRAGVPTARCATFTDIDAALAHAEVQDRPPVVKADWLAAGKGVVVPETSEEAAVAIRSLLGGAAAGARVLLEERLSGREVSVFALISDEAVVPLAAACDYKRLGDGDIGPNTGGMGAYAPVPWFGTREVEATVASVFEPIAWRMARDGTPYRGVLYAGLMLTPDGPMVLEFNARFGDPEAQVLMPLLDGELATAMHGVATGDRGRMEGAVGVMGGAAVGVVIASEGYPDAPLTGRRLDGVDPSGPDDDGPVLCFHGGTRANAGEYLSSGGRVATVVGLGPTLAEARERAYAGASGLHMEGAQYRRDVAQRDLA